MPFGRKIRLTACEMPAGVSGFILFHFTLRLAAKFHNSSELFHIEQREILDSDIIDEKDGYPKYIQILCEDTDRYTWNFEYHKINDCGKILLSSSNRNTIE